MRVGIVQMCSGDDPAENLVAAERAVREAAASGAALVLTPETTNIVSASRTRQEEMLATEDDDPTLRRLRAVAAETGIWLIVGSLALRTTDPDGRFANRSLVIGPDGAVTARYDKIHMFDVSLDNGETYRESAAFRPGDRAVVTEAAGAAVGLTVCYDLRFPHLYRDLAKAGAAVLTVPAAFTQPTGRAHWHTLLRARAIETGCFVLAAAQSGTHAASRGAVRRTFGHSLAVSPWGEVLADAGTDTGVTLVDIDLAAVARARGRIPALTHDRPYAPPR
jgi:deaminated glutathione amidase